MNKLKPLLVFLCLLMSMPYFFSQLQNDATFITGTGLNNFVNKTLVQSDGKIIVLGTFTNYNGTAKNRIVRLNSDGSIDNTFVSGTGFNNDVESAVLQPDGKIIVGGLFTNYNGTAINRIVRLNTNGSIDATFNVGTGADGTVYAIGLQADGKVVLGGLFYSLGGNGAGQIGRLNANGSFDNTFTCTPGTGNIVRTIAFQSDGKILLGGDFMSYNSNPANRIVRLNANGTFDPTFLTSSGFENSVRVIKVQADGKILVGGLFTTYKGFDHHNIVRLLPTGNSDNTFNTNPSGFNGGVFSIETLADGKLLIGGDFTSYQTTLINRLVRINGDGSLDNTFNIGSGFTGGVVKDIGLQSDGKTILIGGFSNYNGTAKNRLIRLNADCVTATVGAASSSPTVCLNSAITAITHTTTGATGIGTASGLPNGVTAAWAANTLTLSGTPTASGTFNYSIPLTGGCNVLNATGTITVRPAFSTGAILTAGETICSGGNPALIGSVTPASGGDGTITYEWYSSTDNMVFIPISGSNSTTYDPPSGLTQKTWYKRYAVDGTCNTNFNNPNNSASGVWIVNVNPIPSAPVVGATTNFSCLAGGTVQLYGLPSSGNWTVNQSGTASGVKVASGSTTTMSGLAAGTYTFTVTDPIGNCTSSSTGSVVISSTPNNTVGAASSSPTLCNETLLTNITHTTTGATGIGSATGLPTGVSATWASNTITIAGTPTSSGTFNYSIPLTGGCGTVNATGTIVVTAVPAKPVLSSPDPTAACSPATLNATSSAAIGNQWYKDGVILSGEVNTTYTATASGSYTVIATENGCSSDISDPIVFTLNLTPQIPVIKHVKPLTTCEGNTVKLHTSSTTGNVWLLNGVPIPGETASLYIATQSGSYTVETTNPAGCLSGPSLPAVVVINPANTVSAASSTPNLCINSALTAITHTTANATGIGTPTGLPAGVTASWAANTITISGTPSESGTFNYSILLTGGCGVLNATGTITVAAENTVSIASEAPILCLNTALNPITHTTTGVTGIGLPTGLPTGVSAAFAGNTVTISGTPSVAGTFNYSIPLTGGCGTLNATGTITVNPENTKGTVTNPTLCINTALTPLVISTTNATGIGATTGLPAGVTATWAADSIIISGTPTSAGVFNYSIPLTGGCGTITANGNITVTAENTVSAVSSNPSLCINTAIPTLTFTTTGVTGIGSGTDIPFGVSANFAANTITLSGTPTVSGIFNYSIPLTGGCGAITANGLITVYSPANIIETKSACGTYTWRNGTTYSASNNTATYTVPGVAAGGCDSVYQLNLTINLAEDFTETISSCTPIVWRDGITYNASNNTATFTVAGASPNGCDSVYHLDFTFGSAVNFTETKTACGSYTWRNGVTYTANNTSATYTVPGAAGGCDSVYHLNLTINPVNTNYQLIGFNLVADATTGTFQWINCNTNSPIAGATNDTFALTTPGVYALVVSAPNGCVDTSNCYFFNTAGLLDQSLEGINIYPNPSNGQITIESNLKEGTMYLKNMQGQLVDVIHVTGTKMSYELPKEKGMYFLEINEATQKSVFRVVRL